MTPAAVIAAALLAPTPATTPKATVLEMFAAFNAHDPKRMARLYAPGARIDSSDFCAPRGAQDVVRTYAALFTDMPDLKDTVETLIAEGEQVAVRFTASSDKADFKLRIVAFLRVRDGLIVADDSVFDHGGRPCTP